MGNAVKAARLGMPFGTANGRLRKAIMFRMAQRLGEDICYRCSGRIATVDELSIEHKDAWLDAPDPVASFFDLDNIAFSHLSCNISAAERANRFRVGNIPANKVRPDSGRIRCVGCKEYKDPDEFSRRARRWTGREDTCRSCRSRRRSNRGNATNGAVSRLEAGGA